MTLQEIRDSDKNILLIKDIAGILEADPQNIRDQAQRDPLKLGFPVIIVGQRVKIPRQGFLNYMTYGRLMAETAADMELKAE